MKRPFFLFALFFASTLIVAQSESELFPLSEDQFPDRVILPSGDVYEFGKVVRPCQECNPAPSKITEKFLMPSDLNYKPELVKTVWKYDIGFEIEFYSGFRDIDTIYLTSPDIEIASDAIRFRPINRKFSEIVAAMGTDYYEKKKGNLRLIEYCFIDKSLKDRQRYLSFVFEDDKCISVEFYDETRFI